LAYLLAQPSCELLGITTVTGEPDIRAMMASSLCRRAGRKVPIAIGAAEPLLIDQLQPHAPQGEALARWPHQSSGFDTDAAGLLRSTIRANPHEVTLVAIGPLTNVAILVSLDPETARLLRGLVVMAGDFDPGTGQAEWNVRCDPHAAAIVARAPFKSVRWVGFDVSQRVCMTEEEVRASFSGPLLEPVLDYATVFFRDEPTLRFFDPVTAATVFEEGLCAYGRGRVKVEICGENQGVTTWSADHTSGPHEIAVDVDPGRYFDHFFQVMKASQEAQ
jgi:purine nucleosidase